MGIMEVKEEGTTTFVILHTYVSVFCQLFLEEV